MKLSYCLSNTQRKEIFVRGRCLTLALPAPPAEVDDPRAWAMSVLPAELHGCVVNGETGHVRCSYGSREAAVAEAESLNAAGADSDGHE